MRKLILLFILAFGFFKAEAQQLPLYSQYMLNRFLLNPAVAGSQPYTSVTLTGRRQWWGYEGAPKTGAISIHSKLNQVKKWFGNNDLSSENTVGLGGYIYNDRNGSISRTGAEFTFSYNIKLNRTSHLAFGISATGYQFGVDKSDLKVIDPNDELINGAKSNFIPDANCGVYFYNERFFAGFSAANLLESSEKFSGTGFQNNEISRHFYLLVGRKFYLNTDILIEPSILLKSKQDEISDIFDEVKEDAGLEVNLRTAYRSLWFAAAYRPNFSFSGMFGYEWSNFAIGFAYEYALTDISNYNHGSTEIMLSYNFGFTDKSLPSFIFR